MAKGEKRELLIEAAKECFYQQGIAQTTLADVSEKSSVPLGNVYYYFRTKEALIDEVIASRLEEVRSQLLSIEQSSPLPVERLKALARSGREFKHQLVQFGCPYGTLCQELEKSTTGTQQDSDRSGDLFRMYLAWAEQQFRLLGKGEDAQDLAEDLIAAIQGTYLLVHATRAPQMLERKISHLECWLDTLV